MKLVFIRHGDPDYVNDSLTPKGKEEALALAKYMKDKCVTKFYCSPLGRAKATAEPTLKITNSNAEIIDWLREFDGYIIDPKTGKKRIPWDLMPADWTVIPELFNKDKWLKSALMQSGDVKEKYENVCEKFDGLLSEHGYTRNGAFYDAVKPNHDTLVFFCHFAVECVILSHLLNVSPVILWQGTVCLPTGITVLATEEREEGIAYFRCNRFGELAHLYLEGQTPSLAASFRETRDDKGRT